MAGGGGRGSVTLCTILRETKGIINAHSRHFLALSVIFILPLSFSITVFPTIQNLILKTHPSNTIQSPQLLFIANPQNAAVSLKPLLYLSYSLFLFTFSLLALASITYSAFHAFFGRPVKLLSALNHLSSSFLRLLSTALLSLLLLLSLCLALSASAWALLSAFRFFGFSLPVTSRGVCLFAGACFFALLVGVQVKLCLACVIVVAESSWGIHPLRRSSWLINRFKRVALSMILFFEVSGCVLVWSSYVFASRVGGVVSGDDGWKSWIFVLQIVLTTAGLTLIFLYNSAASTVLYMYCKAVHGELAWEIAQEFSREYVSLPFDEGKVPYLVSIVYP